MRGKWADEVSGELSEKDWFKVDPKFFKLSRSKTGSTATFLHKINFITIII